LCIGGWEITLAYRSTFFPVPGDHCMASAERLLLVEDDVYIQDLLQSELEEAGFEVAVASSGMRAIAALEADPNRFIAVITDINLGRGPSGWDIGRRARQLSLVIPVVYMTGSEGHHWTTEGVAKSVLLKKPFSFDEIVTAVMALLDSAGAELRATSAPDPAG
jgi:DNA-binding response OmpR family regulator